MFAQLWTLTRWNIFFNFNQITTEIFIIRQISSRQVKQMASVAYVYSGGQIGVPPPEQVYLRYLAFKIK